MRFVKTDDRAIIPTRATEGSAGYDLKTLEGFTLMPRQRHTAMTGVSIEGMTQSMVGIIRDKSKPAHKFGITTLGRVIDSDYFPGEVGVILLNTGSDPVTYKAGDSIAQIVFQAYTTTSDDEVDEVRNGGFGSTGK